MKKATNMILAVIAASLILLAGCYKGGNPQENPIGYDGFIADGWEYFEAAEYDMAMESFQAAIDMDVTRPEGYLGAGWCSIMIPDYWVTGDQYDYMAVQQDGGLWPVSTVTATQAQDLNWTIFQCIDPVLTANDIMVIAAYGDSLLVVEGDTLVPKTNAAGDTLVYAVNNLIIGDWLYSQYGAIDFKYTFEIDDPNVNTIFRFANGFSLTDAVVDSVVNGASTSTVYLTVPYVRVALEGDNFRTWCMYENEMSFEYAIYDAANGSTTIANDGVAAYAILQHARGTNGDLYSGVAALIGLADEAEYSFSHYDGLSSLKLKGMAAAMAYANLEFKFALAVCRSEGYGLSISTEDPDFEIQLMQVIETMLQ